MTDTKALRPAEIEWWDAAAQGGWKTPAAAATGGLTSVRSVGYVLGRDDTQLVLAQSLSDSGNVSDTLAIPIQNVKKVKFLK